MIDPQKAMYDHYMAESIGAGLRAGGDPMKDLFPKPIAVAFLAMGENYGGYTGMQQKQAYLLIPLGDMKTPVNPSKDMYHTITPLQMYSKASRTDAPNFDYQDSTPLPKYGCGNC
ncbi:hypothetical protein JW968_05925 [Candidatus Woesearchaeota archaeon]|nr:hypothetical protein [Candidatus Woesearchaeota archaeon]